MNHLFFLYLKRGPPKLEILVGWTTPGVGVPNRVTKVAIRWIDIRTCTSGKRRFDPGSWQGLFGHIRWYCSYGLGWCSLPLLVIIPISRASTRHEQRTKSKEIQFGVPIQSVKAWAVDKRNSLNSDRLLNRKQIGIEPVDVQCYCCCYYLRFWDLFPSLSAYVVDYR